MPEDVAFQTKPQLARRMLERALESGVPFSWVTGDEIYGSDCNLRLWLERAGIPHLLAIKSNEKLWAWTEKGPLQVRADRLVAQVEESGWYRHITLAMLAHAYLAVVRHHAAAPEWAGERGAVQAVVTD